jgi:hypothetical protein
VGEDAASFPAAAKDAGLLCRIAHAMNVDRGDHTDGERPNISI